MITTSFDKKVYTWLLRKGYTHLYLKGIQPTTVGNDRYYYVIPLKYNDARIESGAADGLIASLADQETIQLLQPQAYARIMIEWSIEEYAAYLEADTL